MDEYAARRQADADFAHEQLKIAEAVADSHDVLRRNGFVRCDIAACNCGSWHARYGLPERMAEIREALAEAGHPLTNDNGNLVSGALQGLIADRDRLQADSERLDRFEFWLADRAGPTLHIDSVREALGLALEAEKAQLSLTKTLELGA